MNLLILEEDIPRQISGLRLTSIDEFIVEKEEEENIKLIIDHPFASFFFFNFSKSAILENNFTEFELKLENKYKTIIIGTFSKINKLIHTILYITDLNYYGRTYIKFTIVNGIQKKTKSMITSDFSNKTKDDEKFENSLNRKKNPKFIVLIPVMVSPVPDPPILTVFSSYMVLSSSH